MQAGLSRAIPSGIIGFMVGALIVIVLRGLQGLDPLWASGPGIVMCGFTTAGFFIWGMGAFDSRLSVHGEAEAAVHEKLVEEAAQPRSLLLGSTWMILTFVVLVFVALLGFAALPGGLALIQTIQPGASLVQVGYADVPLPFGGPNITVSTFVLFALFVLWAFISLALVGGALAFIFVGITRGLAESQAEAAVAGGGTLALPAPAEQPRPSRSVSETVVTFVSFIVAYIVAFLVARLIIGLILTQTLPILVWLFDLPGQVTLLAVIAAAIIVRLAFGRERFRLVAPFIAAFVILYFVFYYVAIGLILPQPNLPGLSQILALFMTNAASNEFQLVTLSFVNALIVALIILYPAMVLRTVGIVARWVAKVMRAVPHFLQ